MYILYTYIEEEIYVYSIYIYNTRIYVYTNTFYITVLQYYINDIISLFLFVIFSDFLFF